MSAEQWRMPNGRHRGQPISRVPVSYLRWMVNSAHTDADRALAELARRGTVLPSLEVSGHAIDRASLRCRKRWHDMRGENEGIHAWLVRVSEEALQRGRRSRVDPGRVEYEGIRFQFNLEGVWPVLLTVMTTKPKPARAPRDRRERDQ